MSLYSHKQIGTGAVQPWSQVITLAEAGKGCDGLFGLYDSLGDKTLMGANTISTLLDGPEKVVRYGALTLGDGTTAASLTASNRCKGLTILCDSLTVKANAALHMTGKGARVDRADDPFFPFNDYKIPFNISLDSSRMSLAQALAVIKAQGLAPWDVGTFQHVIAGMFGFNLSTSLAGSTVLLTATGCGGRNVYQYTGGTCVAGTPGVAGGNGGTGGGGNGGLYAAYNCPGAQGCPYGGGAGSGGVATPSGSDNLMWLNSRDTVLEMFQYSRAGGSGESAGESAGGLVCGGGAGNPGGGSINGGSAGGDGVGGRLTIVCRGVITVQSGGKIEANGMPGGAGSHCCGAGSGGGHISLISPGAVSNAGTIQCAGGTGGTSGGGAGGAGGAGSMVTKTFSDMGW